MDNGMSVAGTVFPRVETGLPQVIKCEKWRLYRAVRLAKREQYAPELLDDHLQ